jgi:V8-like Glu-specific endopeptidase
MAKRGSRASTGESRAESARAKVEAVELEPPLPPIEADPTQDALGIAAVLAGSAHPGTVVARSFMAETYGGGSLENVPDYDVSRAITAGLTHSGNVEWPQLHSLAHCAPETVAEAELRAETVIFDPADTRRRVPNSTVVPWRCIALLTIRFRDGATARGTGWFIAPRTLVTAAHVVHDPIHGRAQSILVTPGFHRGAMPYGSQAVVRADFNPAWTDGFARELDFALVFIAQPAGVGFFGFAAADDQALARVLVNISGYPVDRPDAQWFDGGRILHADETFIHHTIDTEAGQSGAPVFWSDRQQRIGLGIHVYGAGSRDRTNVARRITRPLFDLFMDKKV